MPSAGPLLAVSGRLPLSWPWGAIIICVIKSFKDREDIFDGRDSKVARKACPRQIWRVAFRKLDQIHRVRELDELRIPPGNRLEVLRAERSGQYSIRINQQYRICFLWESGHAYEVEITDYH